MRDLQAAHAVVAYDHDVASLRQFSAALRNFLHRQQLGLCNPADRVFPRFAHVENQRRGTAAIGQPFVQCRHRQLLDQKTNLSGCGAFFNAGMQVSNSATVATAPSPVYVVSKASITGASPTTAKQPSAGLQAALKFFGEQRFRAGQHDHVVRRLFGPTPRAVTDFQRDVSDAVSGSRARPSRSTRE